MKKKWIGFLCVFSALLMLSGCRETKTATEKIVLNEVAHSVFYAPLYTAIEQGYFKEQGLEITLVTGFGADKTMTALLSDEADIGFMGPESTIYTYQGGMEDYAVNFAQLTQRAGNFVVGRQKEDSFSFKNLKGKTVLAGRAGASHQSM